MKLNSACPFPFAFIKHHAAFIIHFWRVYQRTRRGAERLVRAEGSVSHVIPPWGLKPLYGMFRTVKYVSVSPCFADPFHAYISPSLFLGLFAVPVHCCPFSLQLSNRSVITSPSHFSLSVTSYLYPPRSLFHFLSVYITPSFSWPFYLSLSLGKQLTQSGGLSLTQ